MTLTRAQCKCSSEKKCRQSACMENLTLPLSQQNPLPGSSAQLIPHSFITGAQSGLVLGDSQGDLYTMQDL